LRKLCASGVASDRCGPLLEPLMAEPGIRQPAGHGFSLVELMVVAALAVTLIALGAPAVNQLLAAKRLDSIHATLQTDLEFARAEAVRRRWPLLFTVSTTGTRSCYVLYMDGNNGNCDCFRAAGNVCRGAFVELRSASFDAAAGVSLAASSSSEGTVVFYPVPRTKADGLSSYYIDPPDWRLDVSGKDGSTLRTEVNAAGLLTTCSPGGSVKRVSPCP
jgi:Tfp pilus assembly protein FimT